VYSVRRRLTIVLWIGFAVLLAGSGVLLDRRVAASLTDDFDGALLAEARALVALTEQEEGRIECDYKPGLLPQFEREERPDYFQFSLANGTVLLRSARLAGDLLGGGAGAAAEPRFRDVLLPDGRAGRAVDFVFEARHAADEEPRPPPDDVVAAPAPPPVAPPVVLVVARGRARLDGLLARTRTAFFGAGGIALALAVALVWRSLVVGFRPVHALAAQVGRLDAESLGARIGLPRTPRELAPIVEQVNALLRRLEEAFARERRFTGNVAHELRTPIAELRSLAEVGARWPGDTAAVTRFFEDVRDLSSRMERMVRDLLLLARCQAGAEAVREEAVWPRALVDAAWPALAARAQAKGLGVRLDVPRDLVVRTDPDKLAIVLANLLDNAVSHSRGGGELSCAASADGGRFELEVKNPAEPLLPGDLERITEPFWRKDEARSLGEHAGLGLSLAAALASLLRLRLGFAQDPDGTLRARLEGPL
jgi:two-component system sensor histidine kinase QseC